MRRLWQIPIVVSAVVTIFAFTALQAWMGQDGLKVAKLERQLIEQTEHMTLLRAKVAQLGNPRRVSDEADKLGLIADPDPKYLRVQQDEPAPADEGPATPLDRVKRLSSPDP